MAAGSKNKDKKRKQIGVLKDNIEFAFLALPAVILLVLFSYLPMGGVVLAFKKFNVAKGIFGSDWIHPWYKNFEFFFSSDAAWRVTRNTILMNLLFIVVGTVMCVLFALAMFYITKRWVVKVYQTIAIVPSFLSMVVTGYMVYAILANNGFLNTVLAKFGVEATNWYATPGAWPVILLLVHIWHGMGYDSLFYYASLVGIDKEYFEVAKIEGANFWQELRYIILPSLKRLIIIMTVLAIGRIFRGDFGLFWTVTRNSTLLLETTDVVDTYIYRALMQQQNVGMSSAVGLFQSIVGFVLIMVTNAIVRKIDKDSALF